jgi:hypothetical protein
VIGTVQGLVDANGYYAAQVGYSIEEIRTGLSWVRLTPGEWIGADMKAIGEMRALGLSSPYRKQYARPDGSLCDLTLRLTQLDDEHMLALTATVGDEDAARLVERWRGASR